MLGSPGSRWGRALAAGAVAALLLAGCGSSDESAGPASTTVRRPSTTTTVAPSSTTVPTTTGTTTATTPVRTDYVSMYPFADQQEVSAWQASYRAERANAWHLDAGSTALAFTRFLGYTAVDRVVASREDSLGAHVSVGYLIPGTTTQATAAVVHLVRMGSGSDAPWEVVGTDDTDFSLLTPAYASTVASPATVGGYIFGVDESIKVIVEQLHSNGVLGQTAGIPAGGIHSPWTGTVSFARPTDPVVIISASTGGHVTAVERFTVTGVHVR